MGKVEKARTKASRVKALTPLERAGYFGPPKTEIRQIKKDADRLALAVPELLSGTHHGDTFVASARALNDATTTAEKTAARKAYVAAAAAFLYDLERVRDIAPANHVVTAEYELTLHARDIAEKKADAKRAAAAKRSAARAAARVVETAPAPAPADGSASSMIELCVSDEDVATAVPPATDLPPLVVARDAPAAATSDKDLLAAAARVVNSGKGEAYRFPDGSFGRRCSGARLADRIGCVFVFDGDGAVTMPTVDVFWSVFASDGDRSPPADDSRWRAALEIMAILSVIPDAKTRNHLAKFVMTKLTEQPPDWDARVRDALGATAALVETASRREPTGKLLEKLANGPHGLVVALRRAALVSDMGQEQRVAMVRALTDAVM